MSELCGMFLVPRLGLFARPFCWNLDCALPTNFSLPSFGTRYHIISFLQETAIQSTLLM